MFEFFVKYYKNTQMLNSGKANTSDYLINKLPFVVDYFTLH